MWQPETRWNAGLAILSLIGIASVAMAVLGLARVQDIRDRIERELAALRGAEAR